MQTSPKKSRPKIDHGKVAKTLKQAGLYSGKTTRLVKSDKDKIRRYYNQFRFAAQNPTAWRGVTLTATQAKQYKDRGLATYGKKVMVFTKGYDHLRKTKSGDIIMSNAEKAKRFTLVTDPKKLQQMADRYGGGAIGIQVGGVSKHIRYGEWENAVNYATKLQHKIDGTTEKGKEIPHVLPAFFDFARDRAYNKARLAKKRKARRRI